MSDNENQIKIIVEAGIKSNWICSHPLTVLIFCIDQRKILEEYYKREQIKITPICLGKINKNLGKISKNLD